MKIVNHWLEDPTGEHDLDRREIARPAYSFRPTHIIIHYDVTGSIAANTSALFGSGLSYHVAVNGYDYDRERPKVRQYVPFNRRAVHARGFNDKAIGLCIVNPGPLVKGSDGILRTTYGQTWDPEDAIEWPKRHGAPSWRHWCNYSYEERDACLAIIRALVETYPSLHTVCGHEHVSPGQKFDPGPAAESAILAPIRGSFPNLNVPQDHHYD